MAHAQFSTIPNPAASRPYSGSKATCCHCPSRRLLQSAQRDLRSVFPFHWGFYMGGASQLNHQYAQLSEDYYRPREYVTDSLLVTDGC